MIDTGRYGRAVTPEFLESGHPMLLPILFEEIQKTVVGEFGWPVEKLRWFVFPDVEMYGVENCTMVECWNGERFPDL